MELRIISVNINNRFRRKREKTLTELKHPVIVNISLVKT